MYSKDKEKYSGPFPPYLTPNGSSPIHLTPIGKEAPIPSPFGV